MCLRTQRKEHRLHIPPTWLGLILTPVIYNMHCVDSSEVLKFCSLPHHLSKEAGEKVMSTLKGSSEVYMEE